eukprot:s424_g1.t1
MTHSRFYMADLMLLWEVWCGRHQVALQGATFVLGTAAIKREEIAASVRLMVFFCREVIGQDTLCVAIGGPDIQTFVRVAALDGRACFYCLRKPVLKMAWEAHNKVPMESMAFLLGTVALQPEEIAAAAADILCIFLCTGVIGQDTLRSLGCGDGDGVVVGWVAVRCIAGGGGTYVGVLGLQGGVKVPSNKQHVTHWCGTYEFLKLVPYMTSQLLVLLGTYVWSLHMWLARC